MIRVCVEILLVAVGTLVLRRIVLSAREDWKQWVGPFAVAFGFWGVALAVEVAVGGQPWRLGLDDRFDVLSVVFASICLAVWFWREFGKGKGGARLPV